MIATKCVKGQINLNYGLLIVFGFAADFFCSYGFTLENLCWFRLLEALQ